MYTYRQRPQSKGAAIAEKLALRSMKAARLPKPPPKVGRGENADTPVKR